MTGKFIDMFCGMGTIRMGFEQAGWECVSSIEFDKHKRRIYEVIFGHEPEFGDITAVRGADLPYADFWCFGAPCQDFSVAGLRAGLDGSRSGLVREVFRLLEEKGSCDRPEWLLYENVKGMLSSNLGWDFAAIQAEMGELGYDVQWQLLNSKDFGVPQNRERVYTLGHLRARGRREIFPITGANSRDTIFGKAIETFGISIKEATKNGYAIARLGDSVNFSVPKSKTRRGRVGKCVANTLDTACNQGTVREDRLCRFTPRECMRLQGVPDHITDKLITAGISDTQMYRAAGDACTVNVIYEIAKRLEPPISGKENKDG